MAKIKIFNTHKKIFLIPIVLLVVFVMLIGVSLANFTAVKNFGNIIGGYFPGNTYTLSYDDANCNSKSVKLGKEYGELCEPTVPSGYVFDGWNGKNLLNPVELTSVAIDFGINVDENGYISDSTPTTDSRIWEYSNSNWLLSLNAGTYNISLDFGQNPTSESYATLMVYKSDNTSIVSKDITNVTNISSTFTLSETTAIGIFIKSYDGIYRIQLEEGSTATPYEPYYVDSSTKVTTASNHTLKAIFDKKPIYGVKRSLITSSSTWERTDDSVGKVANATHDGTAVVNDFDNIAPWSEIYSYNYDRTSGLDTAKIGDSNFKFDGTNGEVLTKIPEFYYKRYQDSEYEYIQISKYPVAGFTKMNAFSVGRYDSSYDGTQIHSYSGTEPEVNRNITSFRTLSRAVGTNFGQLDYHYFALQMLYLVEYADYNSQTTLGTGATNFRNNTNDKALLAENNVNRIIVDTAVANNFIIGQQISIGTSANGNFGVARFRNVTSKEAYDDGTIIGTAIYFDGNPVDIAVDNVIWSSGQRSGTTDSLGMKSGCLTNSRSPIIYRGIENIFGNVWQFVDGINIKDYVAYVSYDPPSYVVNKYDGTYNAIGYTNSNATGTYATKLGYDANNSLIAFPIEASGGSSTTYMSDYYYSNSGNRIPLVGGYMHTGASAGLWSWNLYHGSGSTGYYIGSRLLRY